jgi:hypothetical protein
MVFGVLASVSPVGAAQMEIPALRAQRAQWMPFRSRKDNMKKYLWDLGIGGNSSQN